MPDALVRPRWGNIARDRKAAAIWLTLAECGAPSDARWLDVGCGSGGIAAALSPRVAQIIGVDPEPWPEWEDAQRSYPNLVLLSAAFDGEDLPFSEGSINVAVCNQVYEHVRDPQALIRNLQRALAPGGICYFAGPNLLWPVEPHVFWPFVHWLPRSLAIRIMRALGSKKADELDAWSAHWWRLAAWFRQSGLQARSMLSERMAAELQLRGLNAAATFVRRMPRWLVSWLSPFAPGFVLVLRKREGAQREPH